MYLIKPQLILFIILEGERGSTMVHVLDGVSEYHARACMPVLNSEPVIDVTKCLDITRFTCAIYTD